MNYKDIAKQLREDIEDFASDLEYDEEIDWTTADKAIGILGAILSDVEELIRML